MIKKMNKKGLEFKLAFFALILVSMSVIAIGAWIGDWNKSYDAGLTYDLEEYNKLQELRGEANDQDAKINIKSTNVNELFEDTSLRGVFGVLNNIKTSFRMVFGEGGMLDALTHRFGLPDYITAGIMTLMSMAIIFTLIAIFFKLSRRNA